MDITFTLLEDVALDSLAITLITANSSCAAQPNHRVPNLSYTLTAPGSTSPLAEGEDSMIISGSSGNILENATQTRNVGTFSFDVDEVLSAGTYTLSLDAWRGESSNAGYYLGVQSIAFTAAVPEPATATQSLLALAGLAARRRRH